MDGLRAEARVCEVFFRRVAEHTLDLRADVGEGGVLDLLHVRYSGKLLDQRPVALLAHDQGLFGSLALRQVYNGSHADPTPGIGQVPGPYLYRKNGAVLLEAPRLVVSGVLVGDTLPHHLPVPRRCELDGVFPDQFLEPVPEHLGNATVGVDDPAVLAEDYSLDDLLGEHLEAFLALPELLLGPLLLGDVVLDAEPVQSVAFLVPDERRLVLRAHIRYGLQGVGVDGFLHLRNGRYLLHEAPEAVLAQAQCLLSSLALPPDLRLPDLALDGGAQPAHVLLGQVVVGPRLHDLHCRVLSYLARDADEREVVTKFP